MSNSLSAKLRDPPHMKKIKQNNLLLPGWTNCCLLFLKAIFLSCLFTIKTIIENAPRSGEGHQGSSAYPELVLTPAVQILAEQIRGKNTWVLGCRTNLPCMCPFSDTFPSVKHPQVMMLRGTSQICFRIYHSKDVMLFRLCWWCQNPLSQLLNALRSWTILTLQQVQLPSDYSQIRGSLCGKIKMTAEITDWRHWGRTQLCVCSGWHIYRTRSGWTEGERKWLWSQPAKGETRLAENWPCSCY